MTIQQQQAFPRAGFSGPYTSGPAIEGMTLQQYAAIQLRVPNSGTEWLDEMITKSLRDEFAASAMQAIITGAMPHGVLQEENAKHTVTKSAYRMADTMLEKRKCHM